MSLLWITTRDTIFSATGQPNISAAWMAPSASWTVTEGRQRSPKAWRRSAISAASSQRSSPGAIGGNAPGRGGRGDGPRLGTSGAVAATAWSPARSEPLPPPTRAARRSGPGPWPASPEPRRPRACP